MSKYLGETVSYVDESKNEQLANNCFNQIDVLIKIQKFLRRLIKEL
jgi:hypothetical protein